MRAASVLLVVAGLLLVLGAQAPWVTCSQEPCSDLGLQHIWARSGFDVDWGVLTAALGVVIVAAAVLAARRPDGRLMARAAGIGALAIATGFALGVCVVLEYDSHGPQVGFVATVLGGLVAVAADSRIRAVRRRASMSRRAGRTSTEATDGDPGSA